VGKASWHAGAAAHAKKWCQHLADTGTFEHSRGSGYGENLYRSWGGSGSVSKNLGNDVSNGWYSEVKNYDYKTGGFSMRTGHFTQLVWKASTGLGCSYATSGNQVVICCNYSPPGNYGGRFQDNVFPPRDTDPTHAPTDAPTDDNPTDTPTDGPTDDSGDLDHFQAQILARHNELRVRHRVGKASWHAGAAAHAKKWCQHLADTGTFEHDHGSGYGENIYKSWGRGGVSENLGNDVSNGWYSEVKNYDYSTGGFSMRTGHFTQMVWKASTGLGCSYATSGNEVVICCNYSPPGNGWSYKDNVLPPLEH